MKLGGSPGPPYILKEIYNHVRSPHPTHGTTMKTPNNKWTESGRNPQQAKRVAYTTEVTESPSYGSRVNFGEVISLEKALTMKLTRSQARKSYAKKLTYWKRATHIPQSHSAKRTEPVGDIPQRHSPKCTKGDHRSLRGVDF